MKHRFIAVATLVALAAVLLEFPLTAAQSSGDDAGAQDEKQIIKAAEVMELFFDPYYIDLRNAMKEEPESRSDWRALYVATFRLAEANNLLFSRTGEEYMETPEWRALSLESRDQTELLGQAILKRDIPAIKERYGAVIESCNACHQKFQLEPVEIKPFL